MNEWITQALQNGVTGVFTMIAHSCINVLIDILSYISGASKNVLNMTIIKNGILYSQALAATLLGVKVAYEALVNRILSSTGGSSGQSPGDLLIGTVKSAVMIGILPWFVRWMYEFGTTLTNDINNINGVGHYKYSIQQVLSAQLEQVATLLIVAVAIIVAIIFVIIILIQSFIRSAELGFLALVGSIMAVGLATNSPVFKTWWNELLAISLTQAIQILMVKLSFTVLLVQQFNVPFINLLMFLGFLWVAYKTPNTVKQFTHATGMGGVAGGLANSGASAMIMRRAMKFTK